MIYCNQSVYILLLKRNYSYPKYLLDMLLVSIHGVLVKILRVVILTVSFCRFSMKDTLDKHVLTIHEKRRPFTCNVCEKSFGARSTLKHHAQAMHNLDIDKKRNLDDSAESSGNDSTASQQDGKRRKAVEGSYQCFHCQQTFPYKFELQDHVEICQLTAPGQKDETTERAIQETISHLDDISKELGFIFNDTTA